MVEDVRGWGLLMGLELKEPNMAGDVVGRCMKKGLLLVPAGLRVVRFVPPLIVKKEEIEEAVRIFGEVMEDIKEEGMGK
jgi:acetylornithine/succinyldiaminopimelate/putrescine aminotransferase